VRAIEEFFTSANAQTLLSERFNCVLDAIDAVSHKALLLSECVRRKIPVVTAGSAGGRRDATALRIRDLAFSSHDRLLGRVRKVLRTEHGFPTDDQTPFGIPSVFSTETPVYPQPDGTVCASRAEGSDPRLNCNSGYGSATFVTGAFGFAAAAEVVKTVIAT
jgi:tRNA A37 threonylcarbamoyladenosine dehydratase